MTSRGLRELHEYGDSRPHRDGEWHFLVSIRKIKKWIKSLFGKKGETK